MSALDAKANAARHRLNTHYTRVVTQNGEAWLECACGWTSERVGANYAPGLGWRCGVESDEIAATHNGGCAGDGDPQEDRDR